MYHFIRTFLFLSALLFANNLMAEVNASVDRNKIGLQETLYYTFSVDGISLTKSPNFSPLLDYFEIVESSQQNNTQIINGSFSTITTWKLALLPKKTGNLYIPPVTFDGDSSKPILITVTDTPPDGDPLQDKVLLKTELDKSSVYPNEQVILTVTLHAAVNLGRSATLSEPDISNAVIKELKTVPGQKEINGIAYSTLTKQFAIFPQEAGKLVIPPLTLQGKALIPSRNRYDPYSSKSVIIRRQSKALDLTVLPKEETVSPWLASKNVELSQQWSHDKTTLQIGNSITRTVIITALGVTGEAIPDISLPETTGFKVYSEAAQTENQITPKGIEGRKIFRFTLIANQSGEIKAPSVSVPWWDTEHNKKQVANLEGLSFSVAPSNQTVTPPLTDPLKEEDKAPQKTTNQSPEITTENNWFYLAITFALLWLVTLLFVIYWIRRKPLPEKQPKKAPALTKKDSTQAYKQLQQCRSMNDFNTVKSRLFIWLQATLPSQQITTVNEGIILLGNQPLQQAFDKANSRLYKEQTSITAEDIKIILDCVKAIEENKKHSMKDSIDLYEE